MRHRLCVGVIGGMGPLSTADFLMKLVRATTAARDQDHLRVVVDNDPSVPDRSEGVAGAGPNPGPHLSRMARGLIAMGAELLVMPCNSAHAFEAEIRAAADPVPFLSVIDTTTRATRARLPAVRRVGLFATDGTLAAGLYRDAFAAIGVEALAPEADSQERVMGAIYGVKRGRPMDALRSELIDVGLALTEQGAQALIAACTEVPLVLRDGDVVRSGASVPLVSSTDALVARTVAVATGSD